MGENDIATELRVLGKIEDVISAIRSSNFPITIAYDGGDAYYVITIESCKIIGDDLLWCKTTNGRMQGVRMSKLYCCSPFVANGEYIRAALDATD